MSPLDGTAGRARSSATVPFRSAASWRPRSTIQPTATTAARRDPFGKAGDFYTAEQIQPVFGILMAARIRQLYREMGEPPATSPWSSWAPDAARWPKRSPSGDTFPWTSSPASCPADFTGVVFSNEFFDALPVEVAICREGRFHRQCVAFTDGRFAWHTGGEVSADVDGYLRRYFPPPEEGRWYEANLAALEWIERIGRALQFGYVLTIDYGYTRAESLRFPAGTLMGYHRHTAREQVLEDPGGRDITAHVNFTALQEAGAELGLRTVRFETLAQTLLAAGEPDQFAAALGDDPARRSCAAGCSSRRCYSEWERRSAYCCSRRNGEGRRDRARNSLASALFEGRRPCEGRPESWRGNGGRSLKQ